MPICNSEVSYTTAAKKKERRKKKKKRKEKKHTQAIEKPYAFHANAIRCNF